MADNKCSRIFAGARVLGYVSTHVPFVARFIKRRGETLLCTSVGKWFHTYGCDTFRLLSVSGEHPGPITCMSGDSYHVYAASENNIYAWRRGCELKHVYKGHKAPIHLIFPFGIHLISIDNNNVLKVFDIKEETEFMELKFEKEVFLISTMCHLPTYLNKILLGSWQGPMQLWNLRTSKLVHTFNGWKSGIRVLEPAPAVDVVAIALNNGKIILHNLRYDRTVVELIHDWGKVSTLSFRLDGVPVLISGTANGNISLWDLEEKKILSTMKKAHAKKIVGMKCLMSEPLMVTNSHDNSLKLWIFDMPDGGPRLLRIREGHTKPPNLVRYCEPTGNNILAAGGDSSLHIMNTISETFNKKLGKASHDRKKSKKKDRLKVDKLIMPPIVKLSSCMQRDKQWDSIASLHHRSVTATTWSYDKLKMGAHKLKPKYEKSLTSHVEATCLTVTHCGNFVIIGYNTGDVHKFNMQSGIHRGQYGSQPKNAHNGAVRGVETDICNQRVITAGADDLLKFWHFKTTNTPYHVLRLTETVSMTKCHRESSLLALANEDFSITLVDIDTMKVVRQFEGHSNKINDIDFDAQSRWLISSSMDCTICTWDIPSGQLVDIFSVEQPCSSLSMSPTGDYLATTHVGELAVFLWANKLLYERIFLRPIDRTVAVVPALKLPNTAPEKPSIEDIGTIDLGEEPEYKSPEQISHELITLSDQPTSRWLNLLNLDIVKKRNKPKTPLTVPKSAPFFLPTIPSLELEFDLDKENNGETKLLIPDSMATLSAFAKKLIKCEDDADFEICIDKLKTLAPAAIEAEVSSMAPDVGGSEAVMTKFLELINVMLRSNKDFELAQSYLSLFLKTHANIVSQKEDLRNTLTSVEETATQAWSKLQSHLMYNICVVKALKDMY